MVIRLVRRWAPLGLAALFAGSGILHLVRPGLYLPLVPRSLPEPEAIIVLSGLAELICAAGLISGQAWAGPASAAVLVAIFPGNVQFALDQAADANPDPVRVVGAWLRLPLQLPLVWAALQARRPG